MGLESPDSVFYVCRYVDIRDNPRNLSVSLAACENMEYVLSVLKEAGYSVNLVSYAWTRNTSGFLPSTVIKGKQDYSETYVSTFGTHTRLGRLLSRWYGAVLLLVELLRRVRKDDIVMVYHSTTIAPVIMLAKKLRGFRLVLELEEIYYLKAPKTAWRNRIIEDRIIFSSDAYIFPNDMMVQLCNPESKPYGVAYGNYRRVAYETPRLDDGKIHVVYAGTIDRKAGAFEAIECTQYLDPSYLVHVIGFGRQDEVHALEARILEINETIGYTGVVYHGSKRGREYDEFLQKCDIGVSCQNPEERYTKYSFPSKVLSYMARDLQVVCSKVECVVNSSCGDLCHFYDYERGGCALAEVIRSIDLDNATSPKSRICELHEAFVRDANILIDVL